MGSGGGGLQSSFESQLRDLILSDEVKHPLVFRGIHKSWDPCTWSLEDWGKLFKDERLNVRYGKRKWSEEQPQWEAECGRAHLTWNEIRDWQQGDYTFLPNDGNGTPEDIWLYYDYRYLPDIFNCEDASSERIQTNENLKNNFCWNRLGFPDRHSDHSTLWIGSKGSYTPCHFDTYSCNLVCQVFGRKRWTLFPPEDTDHLLPTRVPYEESSVYSRLNFTSKKRLVNHFSDLQKCTPYEVVLEAGDCLFVPSKWWHFVQSEDFSISVNTWIELPRDHFARLEEAILRSVTSAVVNQTSPETIKHILNSNELDILEMNETDLHTLLHVASTSYAEHQNRVTSGPFVTSDKDSNVKNEEDDTLPPPCKKSKSSLVISRLSQFLESFPEAVEILLSIKHDLLIKNRPDEPDAENEGDSKLNDTRSPLYLEHLINAIGHPSVLKAITDKFIQNVTQDPRT